MEKQEKKEISISIWDRLGTAIQEENKSKATALFKEMKEEFDKFRASYLDFPNFALTALAEKCGEEAVHDVLRKIAEQTIWVHFGKEFPRWSSEERIRRRAYAWTRSHGVGIDIEEDEEKFIVKIPCDTGGVILGKKECGRVKEPHPWSGGERGVSFYCTHCLIAFEEMAIERYGHPWWITFPPKKAGDRCVQYHYKDITKTPEKYYQRTGKSKPI